ncbi:hypothetical protein UFOVP938_48 [uncultured Caudovirales phage]|uniref:Uncharacterized protein n=1 Tax=uncultured Caudovirales phage TaxID=2100421 RepID=A0A6J5SKN2_9CAUD|nr:hypothetical protein UFOVP596_57 [uncultured Caudovirales phage]CAB4172688.1 hypothetical protein UFOVP938_48 [uncultured Caudovirales phage]CAB4183651.1 hypothetical protein UFOVP1104_53 [uncultured Caudovirales phage]CAB4202288.1 hypothetical protein UFOVP1371_5 [uncultured Caudovirales phage]CAB4214752.1 hypothetical protein UFOVP1468_13 [uncultured Caudovirales phage]
MISSKFGIPVDNHFRCDVVTMLLEFVDTGGQSHAGNLGKSVHRRDWSPLQQFQNQIVLAPNSAANSATNFFSESVASLGKRLLICL